MTVPDVCARRLSTMPAMTQVLATAGIFILYVLAAALDERPSMMFIGLSPLSLVAAETVWHLVDDLIEEMT